MYAVIQTGGKQYRVANGDVITVEKLEGEEGSTLAISPVLMLDDGKDTQVGTPIVEGAAVTAELLEQTRGKKIVVFKKKRRKGYQRTHGHRQDLTVLRIVDVTGKAKAPAKKAAKAAPKTDAVPAETAPAEAAPAAEAKPAAKKAASSTAKKPAAKKPAAKKSTAAKPGADKE